MKITIDVAVSINGNAVKMNEQQRAKMVDYATQTFFGEFLQTKPRGKRVMGSRRYSAEEEKVITDALDNTSNGEFESKVLELARKQGRTPKAIRVRYSAIKRSRK